MAYASIDTITRVEHRPLLPRLRWSHQKGLDSAPIIPLTIAQQYHHQRLYADQLGEV